MAETLRSGGEGREAPEKTPKELARDISSSHERKIVRAAGETAIPGFEYAKFARGEYSREEMDAMATEISRREAELSMSPDAVAPAPAPEPEPVSRSEATTNRSEKKDNKDNSILKTVGIAALGAAVAGASFAGTTAVINNINGEATAPTDQGKVEATQVQENEAKKAEVETSQERVVGDNYAKYFANEDGDDYNDNKSSRNAFGPEVRNLEEAEQTIDHVAYHEPALFASWYYDLDDSVKLTEAECGYDTVHMNMTELRNLMVDHPEVHQQMADMFTSLRQQENGGSMRQDTITGRVVNVYGETDFTTPEGHVVNSRDTVAVHCETTENGSDVVVITYVVNQKTGQTATLTLRMGCGLQNVRLMSDPGAQRIIDTTDPIPDPEPTPTPTPEPEPEPEPTPTPSDEKAPTTDHQTDGGAEYKPETGPGSIEDSGTTEDTRDMTQELEESQKPAPQSEESKAADQSGTVDRRTDEQKTEAASEAANHVEQEQQVNTKQQERNDAVESQPDVQDLTGGDGEVSDEELSQF